MKWWRRLCRVWHSLVTLDTTHAAAANHRHEILDAIRGLAASLEGLQSAHGRAVSELRDAIQRRDDRTANELTHMTKRVARLNEQFSHLSAHLLGKNIAAAIEASRGPRDFTHEHRQ